jgi:hypothetical protein
VKQLNRVLVALQVAPETMSQVHPKFAVSKPANFSQYRSHDSYVVEMRYLVGVVCLLVN